MISIIIPVLNEEKALPDTLASVDAQSGCTEIIVVDCGSEDGTRQLVKQHATARLVLAERGRARQMNAGAASATGEWLLFLHADTLMPEDAILTINELPGEISAGCFHQSFSGSHWFLKAVSWLHNWRCNRSRIIYGDQAMFIRRKLFEQVGGFPEKDILEDVLISEEIVKHTRPVLLDKKVITSSRKFEQRGLFKSFFDIFVIMSCYELRLPIMRKAFFTAFR